jgi:hypothetical protein
MQISYFQQFGFNSESPYHAVSAAAADQLGLLVMSGTASCVECRREPSMTDQHTLAGGCLCGAVRFEVTPPTNWCAHCHCSLCRRAHGAAFVTWYGVERTQFALLSGSGDLMWYRSTPGARRGFCRRCGTTMFFEGDRWPDEIHIALAVMDGPIDRRPMAHVFFDSHVDWFEPGDDLRRLGGPSGNEPLEKG